jgi:hypothetical protein
LLASYEIERRQIGVRNVEASRQASKGRRAWRSMWRPEIRDATPAGHAARAALVRVADVEQRKSNEMIGAELGYRYRGSPIVCDEPGEGPADNFMSYEPTTWPGARLPHVCLDNGTAIQDVIPDGYVLLRLGRSQANTEPLKEAFASLGAPFTVLDIPGERPREVYGYDLLLLRPDMHVVWRGNALPDAAPLARRATGH